MSNKTVAKGVFEQKRHENALLFVAAHLQLIDSVEVMIANAHAITLDPAHRASIDALIGQIVVKETELASLVDSFDFFHNV